MELSEDDHLIIDWAESLLEDNQELELKERGLVIVGAGNSNYEALKQAIELTEIKEVGGKVIAVIGSRQDYAKSIELMKEEAEKAFKESETNIIEMLPPLIEPTLHDCQRPNKRENKNKKGRNSHMFGRQPSKF